MTEPLIFVGTVFLEHDCALLIFLILMQLPKKEAGLGTAFGAGATDALFGSGAGNILTKLTKWCAIFFLSMALLLSVLHKSKNSALAGDQGGGTPTTKANSGTSGKAPIDNPLNGVIPKGNGTAPTGNTTAPNLNATAAPSSNSTSTNTVIKPSGNATDSNKTGAKETNASAPVPSKSSESKK